jgi:hypothetical protein
MFSRENESRRNKRRILICELVNSPDRSRCLYFFFMPAGRFSARIHIRRWLVSHAKWGTPMSERLAKVWAAAIGACRTLLPKHPRPYRPEAHYMRGPGPKWRAKHAPISAQR